MQNDQGESNIKKPKISKRRWIIYGGVVFVIFLAVGFLIHQRYFADVSSDPFAKTCDSVCPKVTIQCLGEADMQKVCGSGAGACAYSNTCTMILTTTICQSLGLKNGQTIDGLSFRKKTDNCLKIAQNNTSYDGLWDCCTVRHEYGHLCDTRCKDSVNCDNCKHGCTETFTKNYDQYCYDTVIQNACTSTNTAILPEEKKAMCNDFCFLAVDRAIKKVEDACMCNETPANDTGITAAGCKVCTEECMNSASKVYGLLPTYCQTNKYTQAYLNSDTFKNYLKKVCPTTTKSGAAHGCSYYCGPADFDYNSMTANNLDLDCLHDTNDKYPKNKDFTESYTGVSPYSTAYGICGSGKYPEFISGSFPPVTDIQKCKSLWEGKYKDGFLRFVGSFICKKN